MPEAVLQTIETNLASSTRRVSGKLSISQSSVVYQIHDLCKRTQNYQILPDITKVLQNFWITLVFINI